MKNIDDLTCLCLSGLLILLALSFGHFVDWFDRSGWADACWSGSARLMLDAVFACSDLSTPAPHHAL